MTVLTSLACLAWAVMILLWGRYWQAGPSLAPAVPPEPAPALDVVIPARDEADGIEAALRSLLAAAHARGLRVVGDLTLNHTGLGHEWFGRESDFYFRDDSLPHGYASWYGVKSLPKLNWGSAALRERMRAWTAYERTAMLVHVASRAATRASHRQVLPVLRGTLAAELGLDG